MNKSALRQVIIDQQAIFQKRDEFTQRDVDLEYYLKGNEIVIITGIRRCGKSTLLKLIAEKIAGEKFYLNFEDIRLTDFNKENFADIEDLAHEMFGEKNIIYFLDEIQNVDLWEKWANNLYSKNIKLFITGSNSNLLSSEISTHLTGRNKVLKLMPFSFKEYLRFKKIYHKINLASKTSNEKNIIFKHFLEYLNLGGFPLIVKNNDLELSRQYFEDILNKDILNRYNIRETKEIKDLAVYLFSNAGKTYSYSTLKEITGIKSLSTIKNYIDYFQNVFLLYKVDKFDYSVKKQKVSSSKVYIGDNVFFKTISFSFTDNLGQKLENLVFLELLRRNNELFYHLDKKECDFVIKQNLKISSAMQVSADLNNPTTKKREVEGILDAMIKYKLKDGLILTLEEEGIIAGSDKKITVKPVWKWLLE